MADHPYLQWPVFRRSVVAAFERSLTVDIRTIQLMLGHTDMKQTQRYLNITDEELRKAMTGVWERRRQLRGVSQ
jgi:integrase